MAVQERLRVGVLPQGPQGPFHPGSNIYAVKPDYGVLYEQHEPFVHKYLLRHTPNSDIAEELTAETFFRGWRAYNDYQDTGAPIKAWFIRIAHNLAINHLRDTSRKPTLSLDAPSGIYGDELLGDTLADKSGQYDPEIQAEKSVLADRVRQIVESLPQDPRTVIEMYYFGGLSGPEIAALTDKSHGAIREILKRTRKKLRKEMKDIK